MHTRPLSFLFALLALGACHALPYDGDLEPPSEEHPRETPSRPLEERAATIERQLARIRGLDFEAPTPVESQDREELRTFLQGEIDDEWESDGALVERAYKEFGLLPRDMDLRPWLADFLKDQIGGYYDPKTKRFYTIKDTAPKEGYGENRNPELIEDFVIAHELTHALDDLHFGFEARDEELKGDDDRSLTFSALAEGDAMDAGTEQMVWRTGLPMSMASPVLRTVVRAVGGLDAAELANFQTDGAHEEEMHKIETAPAVIRSEMLFPYTQGWRFTNQIRAERGWQGVNELFQDPPESTEQILHPERFIDRWDRPRLITLPAGAPDGFRERYQETLGLLRIQAMMRQSLDEDVDGWDGDRYVLWETEGGDALGWLTVWDSEREARSFASLYRESLGLRYGPDGRWAVVAEGDRVAATHHCPLGRAEETARWLLDARVERQDGDEGPDRWYWRALRWPLTLRSTRSAFEFGLVGDHVLDWRSTDVGHKFRLADSLLIHSENNPDRTGFWIALGLIGFASDQSAHYSVGRIPFVVNWHGRDEGEDRRSQFGMLLDSIKYQNLRGAKEFDLLWGVLVQNRWGKDSRDGKRLRILFVPIPGI